MGKAWLRLGGLWLGTISVFLAASLVVACGDDPKPQVGGEGGAAGAAGEAGAAEPDSGGSQASAGVPGTEGGAAGAPPVVIPNGGAGGDASSGGGGDAPSGAGGEAPLATAGAGGEGGAPVDLD